ncbi:flagellar protein FlaG protein [Thermocrinis albus DSM 14484]|uniref:Flagellar protein FlaG protein n=1 Tax=Thermocrinis albus (strain DSM 14484 / JCM 11386 / HI 11/12) TaxID=638303 RepID=D3SMU0_THEAH|nr:flagellar protein FlaG [Thermocrinis albus]ADC90070.1 flagellar protein FlaG protein [Thermocrinis albus DSM 14484]
MVNKVENSFLPQPQIPDLQQQNVTNHSNNTKERDATQTTRAIDELMKVMKEVKEKFDLLNTYLRIDIDRELDIPVVRIVERDTGKVIRQIPPEYILDLMRKIDEMLGILFEKEV